MSDILSQKTAIITGASSGIGEATARLLAARGAKVVLAARRTERLEALAAEIKKAGGQALVVTCDVTDREAVNSLVRKAKAKFGTVDILVNNAGIMPLSFMDKLHVEEWDKMIDVNVKGVLHGISAVLPTMLEQKAGHIVNVSSVAGRRNFPGGAVYCGTKAAVGMISEGLRQELAPRGIRVTTIEPGAVTTELPQTITDADVLGFFEQMKQMTFLEAEDIAQSVLYAVQQPQRVDVAEILVMPTQQA